MQTKKQSLTEAISNTAVGFILSYLSTFLIFPLVGVENNAGTNLIIVIYFTAVSILRGYVIRRWFNKKVAQAPVKRPMWGHWPLVPLNHCFECGHQTTPQKINGVPHCQNCGTML